MTKTDFTISYLSILMMI